jgi:hypothetical protein
MQTESITVHSTYNDILLPSVHLRQLLSLNQISEDVIKSCEAVLNELLTRIIEFAYNGDAHQLITVNLACNRSGVYIETQHEGKPFGFGRQNLVDSSQLESVLQGSEAKDLDEVWYELEMGKNIWQLVKYT